MFIQKAPQANEQWHIQKFMKRCLWVAKQGYPRQTITDWQRMRIYCKYLRPEKSTAANAVQMQRRRGNKANDYDRLWKERAEAFRDGRDIIFGRGG